MAEALGTPTDNALSEYADLEGALADPAVHGEQARARQLGRRYAELGPLVAAIREQEALAADLADAREMAADDRDMAELATQLEAQLGELDVRIRDLLVPKDPADGKDCLLEVKAGEGGDESALFAGDLVRMYSRYAEQCGWQTEVISATEGELGG
ncbi:MAG: PCRF domain-containing protein, partial [Mycobacteriales bacterium]